jgi:N-acetylmuramoyl-L-alanine amidase
MIPLLVMAVLAAHGDSVRVRGASLDTTIATVATPAGPAVRADVVLRLVGGVARVTGFGKWELQLRSAVIGLTDGVPFATTAGATVPLATAPVQQAGAFLLPVELLGDLTRRLGNGVVWDAEARTLSVSRTAVAAARPAPPRSIPARIPASGSRRWVVVVDAGHGGPDGGMHGPIGGGPQLQEKDMTLAVAKRLARELEGRGVSVVMTRTTDTLIALADRGRIANQRQANLFISIHVNAANPNWKDPRAARGFETYFLAEAKTEDERRVAAMENAVTRFESTHEPAGDDALGFILSDMRQNEHLRESSDLAESVQARLGRIHPGPNRGVKQAGFMVLVTSFMPSVLVEIGFGTNPREAAWIAGLEGQGAIAASVADAAVEYLARYERRSGGVGSAPVVTAREPRP